MELYILLEGDVSFVVESSLYKLSAGDAIVTAPNERHYCILNPFYLFSKLYKLGGYIKTVSDTNEIYAVAVKNGESLAIMLTYFTNSEELGEKEVTVKLDDRRSDEYALYLLDDAHDADHIGSVKANDGAITLTMSPNSVVLLEK